MHICQFCLGTCDFYPISTKRDKNIRAYIVYVFFFVCLFLGGVCGYAFLCVFLVFYETSQLRKLERIGFSASLQTKAVRGTQLWG